MARRATVISQERRKGVPVLVLDAGDSLTGDRDPARMTQGQTSVQIMNMMGYDAMALGPNDLALGLDVLQQRISEAQFAVLSANAARAATGGLVADPYALRQFDDHTVAIVGLSGGQGTDEIAVRDPIVAASQVVAEVATRADVVILLSHAGPSLDQQIAESVPGIDLIISGGRFQRDTLPQGTSLKPPRGAGETDTPVLHADEASPGHAGRWIGVARLVFDDQGRLVEQDWQRLNLGPEIESDAAITEWVNTNNELQRDELQ